MTTISYSQNGEWALKQGQLTPEFVILTNMLYDYKVHNEYVLILYC